jgi:hypothetical protein
VSRWRASGIHVLLSAAIAGTVVMLMLTTWYPWPLFEAAGGSTLIFILAAVDVAIGPLITLIVFKSGKKGLRFDLSVIALLQLAALAYGIDTVHEARPVYLVFTKDRFDLVTAKDLDPADLAKVTRAEFKRPPLGRPRYIAVTAPADVETRRKILFSALQGKDLQMYPQYYVPYEEQVQNALKAAKPLEKILGRDPGLVRRQLDSIARSQDSVRFLPLNAPSKDGAVLIDAASGVPLDIVLVDPW